MRKITVFDRALTIWQALKDEGVKNLKVARGTHINFRYQGKAWECSHELHCCISEGAVRSFNAEAKTLTDRLVNYWNKYRG